MASPSPIVYTNTDEAPALATRSLYPIIERFLQSAEVPLAMADISLAGRILAAFADRMPQDQQFPDALAQLGELVKQSHANVIKLPNISASVPQIKAAVAELQAKGFAVPPYPDEATNAEEADIRDRYDKVKGSAVNPVLREGNSDRRAARAVKNYAQAHPHSMGPWSSSSKTQVVSMEAGDFFESEQSICSDRAMKVDFRLVGEGSDGTVVLKEGLTLETGEVLDAATLTKTQLLRFFDTSIEQAKSENLLLSLHMKATMMKVSDPIIFGHGVERYFSELFETLGPQLKAAGANSRNGLGGVLSALDQLTPEDKERAEKLIAKVYADNPPLAMVDSDKGITNLHVPSDIIIDASMPAMIRSSGQMWGPDGTLHDTLAMIPDRSYAGVYAETINFCKENGAFDPATMGAVSNVGLMAKKAEEYGSHDKTFEVPFAGVVEVVDDRGTVLMSFPVGQGDLFRACQTKDLPIQNWISLAVDRARQSNTPVVFWLDSHRAHDAQLIAKLEQYLPELDTDGIELAIMAPQDATRHTLERSKAGLDTISATGNVLRDYLTDLFPILELGTSAKMLSIVPLLNGGGLFETGAGGSAPKHVQQMEKENHLRWDSLGEFLALGVSLEHFARVYDNHKAAELAAALDTAVAQLLSEGKSPSRKVGELDNRGSHFYFAMYWAQVLAAGSGSLASDFAPLAEKLAANEKKIVAELAGVQGAPVDLGGYYLPDHAKADAAMRPSATLNGIIDQ